MYMKITICLLLVGIVSSTKTSQTNKLIQEICDSLKDETELDLIEDRQWRTTCQELLSSRQERNADEETSTPSNVILRKAGARGGGSRGGIRGGTRGGGSRSPSGGGSGSSVTRYRYTRTGGTVSRPTGWQWSRTRLIFLPISTRFLHRSSSSSNRYTTPSSSSLTYYYCTSSTDSSSEIQCDSTYDDDQCCEDTSSGQVYCCGGELPDDLLEDMNRATRSLTRVFYTLAILALFMHLFMRRFYR